MSSFTKEACVSTLKHALQAQNYGADRIELCDRLDLGGTTPSRELIKQANDELNIPIRVMIRPRGGDFSYSEDEIQEMIDAIHYCKSVGVEGVVFGVLDEENRLDTAQISRLIEAALPLKVVIHKAIDLTPDPVAALESLIQIEGVTTVLTSGGRSTAFEGLNNLKAMIELAGEKLEIMPAGKVTYANLEELHRTLGARAYHGKKIVGDLNG